MWKYELRRILVKQKGILFILFALLLEVFSIRQQYTVRVDKDIENNKAIYMEYLKEYSGRYNEKKYEQLNVEIKQMENDIENANNAAMRYYAGEITKSEMSELRIKGLPYFRNLDALRAIHKQYDYAKNNDEAIIIYETGWIYLLGRSYTNLIIPFLLIIMFMPLFTEDYAHEMYRITDCCKNGKNRLLIHRCVAAVIVSFVICVLFMLMDYLYFDVKYGLDNGLANITSISTFKNVQFENSLLVNYVLTGIQLMAGCVIVICIVAFVGQVVKNRFYGTIASTLFVMVPYILFEKEQWVKYLCPISFFTDGGYINGFETLEESRMIVNGQELVKLLGVSVIFVSISLFFALLFNRKKKNVIICLLLIVMCVNVTGCNKQSADASMFLINTDDYCGISEVGKALVLDKDNEYVIQIDGEEIPLHDSPFYTENEGWVSNVITNDNKVYYQYDENAGDNSSIKFYEMDIETMDRKLILEKKEMPYGSDSYLDLNSKLTSVDAGNNFNCRLILAADNFIIYGNGYDIILYNRMNGNEEKILEHASNLCIYNGKLYYINQIGFVMVYDFITDKSSLVMDDYVTKFWMCDRGLVYIDGLELNINILDMKSKETTMLIECDAEALTVNEQEIYYYADSELFVFDMDTSECKKIADEVWYYALLKNRGQILYADYNGEYHYYERSGK